jgi:hypothetical protein
MFNDFNNMLVLISVDGSFYGDMVEPEAVLMKFGSSCIKIKALTNG